ncbi:MAG TPA: hypothetical protein VEQ10_09270 [Vicinamibacteria bacterium]|nr:hypothetical protein [Vicinamibacteria bacterium]
MLTGSIVAADDTGSLLVRGAVLKSGRWSPDEVKKGFSDAIQSVPFTTGEDKTQHVGTGIPLVSLLQKAELKTEKVPKHHELTFLVFVEARDSYRAFFSMAELLPKHGRTQAYLIWELDGKPLSAEQGPFRLIVSSDQAPDRNIYGIATITLVDGTQLATQLPGGK